MQLLACLPGGARSPGTGRWSPRGQPWSASRCAPGQTPGHTWGRPLGSLGGELVSSGLELWSPETEVTGTFSPECCLELATLVVGSRLSGHWGCWTPSGQTRWSQAAVTRLLRAPLQPWPCLLSSPGVCRRVMLESLLLLVILAMTVTAVHEESSRLGVK